MDVSQQALEKRLERKLLAGQRALRRIRFSIGATMMCLGFAVATLGIMFHGPLFCDEGVTAHLRSIGWGVLKPLYPVMLALAPLPDDAPLTRFVWLLQLPENVYWLYFCVLNIPDSISMASRGLCSSRLGALKEHPVEFCWMNVPVDIFWSASSSAFLVGALRAQFCATAVQMQKIMWQVVAIAAALSILQYLCAVGQHFFVLGKLSVNVWYIPFNLVAIWVANRPDWQDRVHARLGRFLDVQGARSAAAGIAGLVGECSPSEVLMQAKERFRCIRLDRLLFEHIADNTPDTSQALHDLTEPVKMHECDAFISHSWHDSANDKWLALQRWRSSFVAEFGREPRVWFDKLCIDQRNIDADLRCLPIFLSGCQELVVLGGTTYLSRLWCVVELFTFVHIKGSIDRINLMPVPRTGHEEADLASIWQSVDEFDAGHCTCFDPNDKEKMLTIIRAAFGSMGRFNEEVHVTMKKAAQRARLRQVGLKVLLEDMGHDVSDIV